MVWKYAGDGELRVLLREGKDLDYTDSAGYTQLSHIIDTVDKCCDIVRWFSADRYSYM